MADAAVVIIVAGAAAFAGYVLGVRRTEREWRARFFRDLAYTLSGHRRRVVFRLAEWPGRVDRRRELMEWVLGGLSPAERDEVAPIVPLFDGAERTTYQRARRLTGGEP